MGPRLPGLTYQAYDFKLMLRILMLSLTGEVGVIERNCKYDRLASPGIVFLCFPFEAVKTR
jgi:hypothetical protein